MDEHPQTIQELAKWCQGHIEANPTLRIEINSLYELAVTETEDNEASVPHEIELCMDDVQAVIDNKNDLQA